MHPAQKLWVRGQYKENGPFADWLKTVKTCTTRAACCSPKDNSNIIVRDYPNRPFVSRVVNKNFQIASGDELECDRRMRAAELKAIKDKEEKERKEAEERERIRLENIRIAEEKKKKEEERKKEEQRKKEEEKKKEEMRKEIEYIAKIGKIHHKTNYLPVSF